ncbi:hypothetical protein ACWD4K_25220, partial [Streptomyces gelaticus]
TAPDALTIHQLLGRIVYFHALHIAPEQCTDLEAAQIGTMVGPDSKAGTGLGDHGVATLCDRRGDLCLYCHHG